MTDAIDEPSPHKDLARAWFRALGDSDYPAMRELMTEDVELWTSPSVREGGIIGRDEVMSRLERVFSSGRYYEPGTFACKVLDVIADGDKTAAHVIMSGRFPNGNSYENVYLIWQRWRGGQMSYQLELFDAAHWANQHKA
jgi:ketosteroid isomerase-like protein